MREKPIIFSTESIRAILDGHKTQTRRVVKPQPNNDGLIAATTNHGEPSLINVHDKGLAPYQPGDVLWVREVYKPDYHKNGAYLYKADAAVEAYPNNLIAWLSPIYMPREAARIFLRVTDRSGGAGAGNKPRRLLARRDYMGRKQA